MAVPYTSGYTIDTLRNLDDCITGCVLRVEVRGKVITYRSLDDLKRARQCVYDTLIDEGIICPPTKKSRNKFFLAQCDDGFGRNKNQCGGCD